MQQKRAFLLGVIGSLSLAALLGIVAFVSGDFGDTEAKVLLSTLIFALFCLTSLGAAIVMERGRWHVGMLATFVLSVVGLVVYLSITWAEPGWRWPWWDLTIKVMVWLAAWSIALPYMGLLSLAPLSGFYLKVRKASVAAVLCLAVAVSICALAEGQPDEEAWVRIIGVLSILTVLGTITVPVLVKVAGIDKEAGIESTTLDVKITCPRCLLQQTVSTGHSRCSGCKLRFEIRIEEPRCPRCDYLLHKLTAPVCPECGFELGAEELVSTPDGQSPEVNHGGT